MRQKHSGRRPLPTTALALAALGLATACTPPPTVEEARTFLEEADSRLLELGQIDLKLGRRAEAQRGARLLLNGLHDVGMAVSENHGPP